ncbi:hypothetical protein FE257_002202 [Aspergillus nanangensis]|uniref:Uncharacterized protein n=1 Tax=Aspergillus nanangensis TaxID=2582783 RepID=A0AAD4CD37_ASPNN|nr:hypothetical protein FE257_002202 [Aspergillus nanangensis]
MLGLWSFLNQHKLKPSYHFQVSKWAAIQVSYLFLLGNLSAYAASNESDSIAIALNIILAGSLFTIFCWIEGQNCKRMQMSQVFNTQRTINLLKDLNFATLNLTAKILLPLLNGCQIAYGFLADGRRTTILRILIAGYCIIYAHHLVAYTKSFLTAKERQNRRAGLLSAIIFMAVLVGAALVGLMAGWSLDAEALFLIFVVQLTGAALCTVRDILLFPSVKIGDKPHNKSENGGC